MMPIQRVKDVVSLTMADNSNVSDGGGNSGTAGVVDCRSYAYGMVKVEEEWVAADLGFQVSDSAVGTFTALYDEDGARVKITTVSATADQWYDIPAALFGARFFKLASLDTADGTAENQTGGPCAFTLMLGT